MRRLRLYEKDLEIYDINYKNEVAYLLYKGILTTDELPSYIGDGVKANALKRHEAAILLTKLMGGTKKAQAVAGYSVNYADLNDIPQASLPYVNYVNETGVMKGHGKQYVYALLRGKPRNDGNNDVQSGKIP